MKFENRKKDIKVGLILIMAVILPLSINAKQFSNTDTITVVGVGDIMLGTLVPSTNFLPKGNDCSPLLKPTSEILRSGDVTFGNLEGVLVNSAKGAKNCGNSKNCYTFGMPSKYADCLVDAGFDLISIANNHSGDFNRAGRINTMNKLKEVGLTYAGLESCPSAILEKDGLKYGFCAFAPNKGTIQINDYERAKKIVGELDKKCDIVIVSFHGGAEGSKHQHVKRKYEMFLGQNRGNVYEFARKVIDAGADIVFGHGPHVSRAVDMYKNRFIIYSMGNFCTWSRINLSGVSGLAPIVKVHVNKRGEFLSGEIISTYQTKYKPPRIDKDKRVLKKIKQLTLEDIPEVPLIIKDDGTIVKK